MSTITQLAKRQRTEVETEDAANLEQLARAYGLMYDRLSGDVESLRLAIDDMDDPSVAEVKRLPQYKTLMRRA